LISLVSRLRAEGTGDDGPTWAATASRLGRRSGAHGGAEAVEKALAAHRLRVG
jgi:hypothetical protein